MSSNRDQLQMQVSQAIRLHQAGQVAQAEQIYRRVLSEDPNQPDALHLLGLIAHHAGHAAPAMELMNRAIAIEPRAFVYHANLAKVYRSIGRLDEATASARRAMELNSDFIDAWVELSACLRQARKVDEAEQVARDAIRRRPDHPEAHGVLANALSDQGRYDEALIVYDTVLRLRPGWGEAVNNFGDLLRKLGRMDEAEPRLREAIRLTPQIAEPHFNLSLLLLLRGDFESGWDEYEWRWKQIGVVGRALAQPTWDGSNLGGKTILLYGEQGLGDVIQFIRYAPLVRDRGGRVIVECEPPLVSICKTVDGVAEVVATREPLPAFDVQCPLASLPHRFRTRLETIPNQVPYIAVDPQRAAFYRERLRLTDDVLNVGLVWGGSPVHKNDFARSCRLSDFAPLASAARARFFSLQLGPAKAQLADPPPGLHIEDATAETRDFSDTAALLSQLDLLISVDTAPAHLAGALARPVWTLHAFVPDFRWLLDRDDSPWYPTMKLFRQARAGEWRPVMMKVTDELNRYIGDRLNRAAT